jgi:hypothetical protein
MMSNSALFPNYNIIWKKVCVIVVLLYLRFLVLCMDVLCIVVATKAYTRLLHSMMYVK